MALLEKAAGQGHVYAMWGLGSLHISRKAFEPAMARRCILTAQNPFWKRLGFNA